MDRNSVRTSVVIEVANQEEPEDQKTYQIDFDDLDIPKDYIIDQVFCGENITVYALFEVPEDSNIATDELLMDVSSSKMTEGYRFFHKNLSKKIVTQNNLNVLKQIEPDESTMQLLPNKDNGTESFYCLKHLSEDYDLLTPERKNSDLKILYSKSPFIKNSKSTKFKAVSKGVNTDIVQSPKIIQEVQKAVKQSIPFSKVDKRTVRDKSPSFSKPSYEVIEMEMRQSFSSLSSHGASRKASKKSVPNFFLVPLLMMDDGVLSHFQSDEKIQKVEDKLLNEQPPAKITTGTNTDVETAKTTKENEDTIDLTMIKNAENNENQNSVQKETNFNGQPKVNHSKLTILNEIKKLQGKLNSLIKSMESTDFSESDSETPVTVEELPTDKVETSENVLTEPTPSNRNKFDDVPILSLSVPLRKKSDSKKKQTDSSSEEKSDTMSVSPTKSVSMNILPNVAVSKSQTIRTDDKWKEELKTVSSEFEINFPEVKCHRGVGLSKSATTLASLPDPKLNLIKGMKKSLSFDLKDDKLEVSCLKKIKNISFKLDAKPNIRIPQKGEGNLKCEMGDEAFNKSKSSKIDLLSLSKAIERVENLKLDNINLDSQKNLKEEEGDAKLVYSKKNAFSQILNRKTENVGVHFVNTITRAPENLLITEKSLLPNPEKSKPTCNSVDTEQSNSVSTSVVTKVCNDLQKPTTPNKTLKKGTPPNYGPKKEVKTVKKLTTQANRNRVAEKPPKADTKDYLGPEIITKQRSVTGSRKFTLKGTAESKLHVDRLMKPENAISSKSNAEKAGNKSDRLPRFPTQKRESTEPPHDVVTTEIREKTEKNTKSTSFTSPNKREVEEDPEIILEKSEVWKETSEGNPSSNVSNQPGVVVELLDEKPIFTSQENQPSTLSKNRDLAQMTVEKKHAIQDVSDDSLNLEKPVVKSVWALTKVLLFEDGTKKIEILEASLTPPGYLPKNPPE